MKKIMVQTLDFKMDAWGLADLFKNEPNMFYLDSSLSKDSNGRYSFIGFSPFDVYKHNGVDSLSNLRKKFLKYFSIERSDLTPFSAGIVGFLSYDLGLSTENIAVKNKDDLAIPHACFYFYDTVITIDHYSKKVHITSIKDAAKIQYIYNKIEKSFTFNSIMKQDEESFKETQNAPALISNFSKVGYIKAVNKALNYISQGDIYQVNLSQRFCFELSSLIKETSSIEIYKSLRNLSPTSFGAYINCDDYQIISSSPERFLQLRGHNVQTRPMKGTRPRGETRKTDQNFKNDLWESEKERAELLMITDLERNDLGRVCEYGSVKVSDLRVIEEYETVFQATSTIEGKLSKSKDAFDLLAACFPGGSITGCPKIRSMEVIEELEPTPRSVYTGALGYISNSGDMDFNVLIRTILKMKNKVYFHVGSGIVADSNPKSEYNETLLKAKAMKECLIKSFADQTVNKVF